MSAFEPVRYAALTDVGVKRSHNQDALIARPAGDAEDWKARGHVFVVADGMGGHAVGEKASAKAVSDIPHLFAKHTSEGIVASIRRAFVEANTGIFTVGQENPEFRGMGTTATALVLRPEGAWVGHVGDSRCYRIRGTAVHQLTFDHSWVWEIARRQGVDPDELGDFKRNVILRSLGPDANVDVDIEGPHPLQPGDTFLLCSDGLSNQVSADEMGAVVSVLPPDEAARFLIELANIRGGPDNVTVLLVQVAGLGGATALTRALRPSLASKVLAAWNRRVPWPFTLLGAGCGLAGASLAMNLGEVPGAAPLFVLAAALILGGLAGLAFHLRRDEPEEEEKPQSEDDAPRELHIHKTTDATITPALIDRLTQLEAGLAELMKAQEIPADWAGHQRLADRADAEWKKGPTPDAFRARCQSLGFLAAAFNKSRHKEETFQPNWTTKSKG